MDPVLAFFRALPFSAFSVRLAGYKPDSTTDAKGHWRKTKTTSPCASEIRAWLPRLEKMAGGKFKRWDFGPCGVWAAPTKEDAEEMMAVLYGQPSHHPSSKH